jgi:hypothetical protein
MTEKTSVHSDYLLIKQALEQVPHAELVKLLMFIFFVKPNDQNELLNNWLYTQTKIGNIIKKYLVLTNKS